VAVATMFERLAWNREDISWAQNQYSSLKHNKSQMTRYALMFFVLCIIKEMLAHELSYTSPMSMPTSKLNNMYREGSYARLSNEV